MPAHVKGLGPGLNANQLYIQKRRIDNVKDLANLAPDDLSLMNRADGTIKNLPKDGFLQVPELTEPNFNAMLLPQEAAHLPAVWNELSWNGREAPDLVPVPGLSAQVAIAAGSTSPPLNRDEPIAISSLPPQFQVLAQRVQLKLNGDNNAATISPNEARNFLSTSFLEGLLPEEKALVPAMMQAVFDAHNKLHPYLTGETVALPKLGIDQRRLNDAASQALVSLRSDTALSEVHRGVTQSLTLTRQYSVEVTVPTGMQGLLINSDTGVETKVSGGVNLGALPPGDYLLEVWQNNARVDESEFHMPSMPMSESVDLTKSISASLSADGAALHKSFRSANPAAGVAAEVVYDFTSGPAVPVPANVDLSRVQPAHPALMPGVYQGSILETLPSIGFQRYAPAQVWRPFSLEVRPDGVVNLTLNGVQSMLNPEGGQIYGGAATLVGTTLAPTGRYIGKAEIQPADRTN